MASVAASAKAGVQGMFPAARQLGYAWIIGSAIMGTVAAIFVAFPPAAVAVPLLPNVPVRSAGTSLIEPLAGLPTVALAAVLALVAVLFAALAALAWRTSGISLLPASARGPIWWALLVGGFGVAAWIFATAVTFGASVGTTAQLVLAYTGGGLPFTLVAAILQRSWKVSAVALCLSAALVAAGVILVASRAQHQSALSLYFSFIRYLFGSKPALTGGPIPGGPPFANAGLG
jgi:hypothetical protein